MNPESPFIDSLLPSWEEVERQHSWSGLLVGNGASRAVWEPFKYGSLYDKACSTEICHPLTAQDQALFAALRDTRNFEAVLGSLATAQLVNGVMDIECETIAERYQSIQHALVEAVHAVHLPWRSFPEASKERVRSHLLTYDWVFSTNYDLLIYWSMMSGDGQGFKDFFWSEVFDLADTEIRDNPTRVLYLHGALHLYRSFDGSTIKDRAGMFTNLLDRFGTRPDLIPLFITEGSHEEKLRGIARSDYLSFALQEFRAHGGPLVVFGHSLGDTDRHLVDAMRRWKEPHIAFGMLPLDDSEIVEQKARIVGLLPNASLTFFDASTHPLGASELRVSED